MPTRLYVRTTDEAVSAVAEIARLVKGGFVDPLVSFDVETMPIPGLEGYPGTSFDEAGERIKPAKRHYLEFAQQRWAASFNLGLLACLNLRVPRRLTAGNERPGVPAKAAWAEFLAAVAQTSDEELEKCRWTSKEAVLGYQVAVEEAIAETSANIEALAGVKGKKKAVEALKSEKEHLEWKLTRIPTMLERVEQPLDLKLLRHIVTVGVENRVKVDPVTPGLDPYTSDLFTVQITLRGTLDRELTTWVFNILTTGLDAVKPVFKLGRAYKYVAHNAKFDLKMLMHKLGLDAAPRNILCTRIGSRMLYLGLKKMSHSLKACAHRFSGIKMDKAVRDTFIGQRRLEATPEQIGYGAIDTELLFDINDKQFKLAEGRGQVELLREFEKLSWITAKQELNGFLVDEQKWDEITAEATKDRDQLARRLEEILLPPGYLETFGGAKLSEDDLEALDEAESEALDNTDEDAPAVDTRRDAIIRISQTKLVGDRLIEVLGERVAQKAFPDGKVSLGKDARGAWERAYREAHGGETHEFFHLYELWSKRAKQVSTYGKKFLWAKHPLTGAIHPNLNIAGTDTGRYSSNRPNMLNVPAAKEPGDPDFRGAFVAPEGCYFLGGDMEAMELRIAGNVTREPVVKKMIESGGDPHSFTAAQMFHIVKAKISAPRPTTQKFKYGTSTFDIAVYEVPESWTAEQIAEFALTPEMATVIKAVPNKTTRTVAKMVTFLWLFRGTAFTLAMRTGLPVEQCEDFFDRFNRVYATMAAGMDALADQVLRNVVEGNDGFQYVWSEAYGGLRRWFVMPENPSRRDYPAGWVGDGQFNAAQRFYKRKLRSIQREGCNVPMQGGNAVVTAKALNQAVEQGYPMRVFPWLAVYDEIIAVAPDTVKPEVVKGLLEGAVLDSAAEFMEYIPCGYEADLKKVSRVWVKS